MCTRIRNIIGEGAGWLGAGLCHDSDGGRLGAGADSAEGRAPMFKFSSGREVAREPGCGGAGRPEPTREGRVRGAVRGPTTSDLGWKCRPAGEAGAARGGAGSLADALPSPRLTASQGGGVAVGGEPAEGLETMRQAGDRSRTQVPRCTRGPAGSHGRHCERRRGTARGRDYYTWPAGRQWPGPAPGRRCG